MSAVQLLNEARSAGIALTLSPDGTIHFNAPRDAITELLPRLRAHRDGILRILRSDAGCSSPAVPLRPRPHSYPLVSRHDFLSFLEERVGGLRETWAAHRLRGHFAPLTLHPGLLDTVAKEPPEGVVTERRVRPGRSAGSTEWVFVPSTNLPGGEANTEAPRKERRQ